MEFVKVTFGIRYFAVGIGSILSGLGIWVSYFLVSEYNLFKYKAMLSVIKLSGLGELIMNISFLFIVPILISIFILVATRNFKELNQLIEENKKL